MPSRAGCPGKDLKRESKVKFRDGPDAASRRDRNELAAPVNDRLGAFGKLAETMVVCWRAKAPNSGDLRGTIDSGQE